jgi:hypothetical protein
VTAASLPWSQRELQINEEVSFLWDVASLDSNLRMMYVSSSRGTVLSVGV